MRAPRALAASPRSRTSAAAPSPSTKPSRALSKGREARSGSSLRVLIARMAAKPAIGSGWMHASVPPTATMSARSNRSRSNPQRTASAPDAQALTGACTPPLAPTARPTAAAGPLGMSIGMVKGETRLGPFCSRMSSWSSRVTAPPMPVPKTTAIRSGSTPESAPPASRQASSRALTATCWLRSSRRARTRSSCCTGSSASRATSWAGKSCAHSSVSRLTPDRPASSASQVEATSPPRGVLAPSPVTTTSAVGVLMTFLLGLTGRTAEVSCWSGPAAGSRCEHARSGAAGSFCYWFFSMKEIASPTVLMLPSSSSGMATPNLSSTAVAISTIDSESTSRSSVKDFSGVASAGVTPATSSRISPSPAWISWVLATRGPLSRMVAAPSAVPPSSGDRVSRTDCKGGTWLGKSQNLPGEGEPGAVAEHQREVAGLGLAGLEQLGERQRDRRGRGVAGLHDVAGDHRALGQTELLGHRLDDAQVGLVRGEDVDVLRSDAGGLHRLDEGLGQLRRRPAVDGLPGHGHGAAARGDLDGVVLVAVAAPGHRADAGLVGGTDDRGAGAVGEDHRGRPVVHVGHVGQPLHADDEGVAGGPGADRVADQAEGVAEARAPGVEVEGAGPVHAQPVGDLRADAGDGLAQAGAGRDDHVDLVGRQTAGRDGLAGGGDRHLHEGLVLARPTALGDADPGLDPLVVGVHHLGELVVGHPAARPIAADAEDAGTGGALPQLDVRGHAWTSG